MAKPRSYLPSGTRDEEREPTNPEKFGYVLGMSPSWQSITQIKTTDGSIIFDRKNLLLYINTLIKAYKAFSNSMTNLLADQARFAREIKPKNFMHRIWNKSTGNLGPGPMDLPTNQKLLIERMVLIKKFLDSGEKMLKEELGSCADQGTKARILECIEQSTLIKAKIEEILGVAKTIKKELSW